MRARDSRDSYEAPNAPQSENSVLAPTLHSLRPFSLRARKNSHHPPHCGCVYRVAADAKEVSEICLREKSLTVTTFALLRTEFGEPANVNGAK